MGYQSLYESIRAKIYEEDGIMPQEEVEVEAAPEVTPQLVEELAAPLGIEDKEQFAKGLQCELKHYDCVEKKIDILAKIVATNMGVIPDWYTRVEAMEAAYQAEKEGGVGEEEVVAEEPVASIDNEEVVAEESVAPAPIDSKPAAATAITSEGLADDDAALEPGDQIGQGKKREFPGVKKGIGKYPAQEAKAKVKEGRLDYSSIDTGDTEANLKALTEKFALAEKKIEELTSLLADQGIDIQKAAKKPEDEQHIDNKPDTKPTVAGGEAGKGAQTIADKGAQGLAKSSDLEKIGDNVATKVPASPVKKMASSGYKAEAA